MRFVVLIGFLLFPASYPASNIKRLRLMAMYQLDESNPLAGHEFIKAVDAAVTYANSQAGFFPAGYQVEVEYRYAGIQGNPAITIFYSWLQNFNAEHENVSILPILIGTLGANGCFSMGLSLQYMNAILATCPCPALELTSGFPRAAFPNLHRYLPGHYDSIAAHIAFIKDIGHWNKVALLTLHNNVAGYQQAYREYAFLQAENITVVHFAMVQSFDDDTMLQIQKSNARIIILSLFFQADGVQFLCSSIKYGMTGPNFVFLIRQDDDVDIWTQVDLYKDRHFCSNDVILEQLKISYWFPVDGLRVGPTVPNVASLDTYDSAISTLAVLKSVEQQLQASEFNLSLSDYFTHPDIVSNAINSSLYHYRVDYSTVSGDYKLIDAPDPDRLQAEFHPVTRRINGANGFDLTVATLDNPYLLHDWFNYSSKYFKISTNLSSESIFFYGKPPHDYPGNFTVAKEVSEGVFGSIVAIAVLITGLAIGLFGVGLKFKNSRHDCLLLVKVASVFGCILLNVSAAMFSARVSLAVCYLERICGVIGFSLIIGPLAGAMLAFRVISKESEYWRMITADAPNSQNCDGIAMETMSSMTQSQNLYHERQFLQHTVFALSIASGIASVIMLGFFIADPITVTNSPNVIVFDASIDSFVTATTLICSSIYGQYRDYTFVAIQTACLALASLIAFRSQKTIAKIIAKNLRLNKIQVKALRFALWNLTGLTIAGLLIVAILGAASVEDGSVVQRIAMSFFLLFGSACTIGAILLLPLLKLKKANIVAVSAS